jgi:hypothetical protein
MSLQRLDGISRRALTSGFGARSSDRRLCRRPPILDAEEVRGSNPLAPTPAKALVTRAFQVSRLDGATRFAGRKLPCSVVAVSVLLASLLPSRYRRISIVAPMAALIEVCVFHGKRTPACRISLDGAPRIRRGTHAEQRIDDQVACSSMPRSLQLEVAGRPPTLGCSFLLIARHPGSRS